MSDYRRPGVYLEEQLQTSPSQQGSAVAVAVFIGVTPKGDAGVATRVDSWSDFVQKFGGFDTIPVADGEDSTTLLSYLPYAVFSYYQNGGRGAYIIRVLPTVTGAQGASAEVDVTDGATTPVTLFTVQANGVGNWGNNLQVRIFQQALDPNGVLIFGLTVYLNDSLVETFNNLSMTGVQGTRPVLYAVNDPVAGSRYVQLVPPVAPAVGDPDVLSWDLQGGSDPGTPAQADLTTTEVTAAIRTIEGPLLVCFQPFAKQDGTIVMPTAQSFSSLNDGRSDIFVVWDGDPISLGGTNYVTSSIQKAASIGQSESYAALYIPWVIIPDPSRIGATISVPPSGSVAGVMSRIDANVGPWRAPAGLPAVLSTAIATETKFTDTDQGNLNSSNVNVVRAVPGSGICIMGARTRKLYGPDRYVGARRTLIYIEDRLRFSTQYAVFENNDTLLWSSLRTTAQNVLQPVWEGGGLAGSTADEAYFITCDETVNTPQVVQSGEVRMEIGVSLQYPAEFVIIRISQFDSGASVTSELVTVAPTAA